MVSNDEGTNLRSEPAAKKQRQAPPDAKPKIPLRQWLQEKIPGLDLRWGYPSLFTAHFPDTPVPQEDGGAIEVTTATPRYTGIEDIGRQPLYASNDAYINGELQRLQEAYMAADDALAKLAREMADYITLDKTGQFPYKKVLIEEKRGEVLTQAERHAKRPTSAADGSAYLGSESDNAYVLIFRADDDGWILVPLTAALYKTMMAEVAFAPSQQRPPITADSDKIPTVPVHGGATASEKRVSLHPPHPYIKKYQVRRPGVLYR